MDNTIILFIMSGLSLTLGFILYLFSARKLKRELNGTSHFYYAQLYENIFYAVVPVTLTLILVLFLFFKDMRILQYSGFIVLMINGLVGLLVSVVVSKYKDFTSTKGVKN